MNIFVIPSTYPNNISQGAGIFIYQQCGQLFERGNRITVLDASSYGYKHWTDKSCRMITVSHDDMGARYTKHIRGLMMARLPRMATNQSRSTINSLYKRAVSDVGKPDLIIAHFSFPAGFIAIEIAKREHIPCVVIEHSSLYLSDKLHPFISAKLKDTIEQADKFVCVSDSLKRMIRQHTQTAQDIYVIPNMISDRFKYSPMPESKPFVFLSAGNFYPNKRFSLLIDGFCRAFPKGSDVCLSIAGKGLDAALLQEKIIKNDGADRIKMLGWIPNEQMPEYYRNSHCFVLLSEKETFGIVYREAMATGRPVIASKNGGIEENWDDMQGILISEATVGAVADALKRMYEHCADYNGKRISERCIGSYSAHSVIDRQMELFESIIKQETMRQ